MERSYESLMAAIKCIDVSVSSVDCMLDEVCARVEWSASESRAVHDGVG
jgi:hypothetical protein